VKEKCGDLVGQKVVLVRCVETKSGNLFPSGTVMRVDSTWRGLFMLSTVDTVYPNNRSIRMCNRFDFQPLEILP
jgi:hypothetical protein